MGNTDSAISGMQTTTQILDNIPILGGAFQLQSATLGAGTNILGGIGQIGKSGNNLMLMAGLAVVVLVLLK